MNISLISDEGVVNGKVKPGAPVIVQEDEEIPTNFTTIKANITTT